MSWNLRCTSIALAFGLAAATALAAHGQAEPADRAFVALSVPDAAAAADWYQKAFGLRVLHEIRSPDGRALVLIVGSDHLSIELVQLRDSRPPDATTREKRYLVHGVFKVGFHVADLDQAVAHLREFGVEFVNEIIEDPKLRLRFVLVRDPFGNLIQLFGEAPADPL